MCAVFSGVVAKVAMRISCTLIVCQVKHIDDGRAVCICISSFIVKAQSLPKIYFKVFLMLVSTTVDMTKTSLL